MSWLIPRDELTTEQIRAVELSPNEHRVILGAPGSGKTQILLHRARFLTEECNVRPDRFHIFVYTNVLKKYIRTALADLDLPEECVTTFDDWCTQVYKREIKRSLPWDEKTRRADYKAIRKAVHQIVRGRNPFDFILVDEGQDLDGEAFALLRDLAPHITVAMDHKQQIYEDGSGEAEIVRTLGLRRSNMMLLDAFRCCPYIVRIASDFIESAPEREAFMNQTRTSQTEIQTPLLYQASGLADERARMIEVLRERQIVDRSIAILFAQNRQVEGFAQGLRDAGVPVETRKSGLDFGNSLPKLLTIHSAKGLTFDTVLMPRLVPLSFTGWSNEWTRRLLYVGMTRAIKWLYLSTVTGQEIPAIATVRRLAELKPPMVTIGHPGSPSPQSRRGDPEGDDPLDIL